MACGCGRRPLVPRQTVRQAREAANQPARRGEVKVAPPKMVQIVYQGPIGTHMVPSPMRLVRSYGLHTRGDSFMVHQADQQAKPQIFVLTEENHG